MFAPSFPHMDGSLWSDLLLCLCLFFNSSIATLLLSTGVQVWFPAAQVPESLLAISQPASKQKRGMHHGAYWQTIDIYHLAKLTFHLPYRHATSRSLFNDRGTTSPE